MEDTFVYILGKRLRERLVLRIEVVNAGHAGATIDHELVVFERLGVPLRPNVVILQFFANGVEDLFARDERQARYRPIALPFKNVLRQTATYRLLLKLKLSMAFAGPRPTPDDFRAPAEESTFRRDEYYTPAPSQRFERGWKLYLEYLGRLLERTRRERAHLVILVVPDEYQVRRTNLFPAPQETLGAFGRQHGIPVADPLPSFRRLVAAGDALYLPHDGHLTPRGHAAIAELLLVILTETKIAYPPN